MLDAAGTGGGTRVFTGVRRAVVLGATCSLAGVVLMAPPAGGIRLAVPNVNVSRASSNQDETAIAIDPANPLDLVVTSNLESGVGLFHAWSTDGGAHWNRDVIADG